MSEPSETSRILDQMTADAEEQGLPDHATADCPECQHALRPTDAGEVRTWPMVVAPGLDAWLRHLEDDDAPEPVDAAGEARTGTVAANRPWLARGDNHQADDAREGYFTPRIEGHLTWIRCPRCAWPMVEGLCGQCGFVDYDYDDAREGQS